MLITLRDSWRGFLDNSERSTGVGSLSASAPWWSKGKTWATVSEWTRPWARFSVKCGPAGCWGSWPGPIRQQKHQGGSSNDIWMSGMGKNPRDVIPTIIIALWLKMGHYQRERRIQKVKMRFFSPPPPTAVIQQQPHHCLLFKGTERTALDSALWTFLKRKQKIWSLP